MSLLIELRSNIVVFRAENKDDVFLIGTLAQKSENCTSSPDGNTVVVVYNTEVESKKFFDGIKDIIKSFRS